MGAKYDPHQNRAATHSDFLCMWVGWQNANYVIRIRRTTDALEIGLQLELRSEPVAFLQIGDSGFLEVAEGNKIPNELLSLIDERVKGFVGLVGQHLQIVKP